MRYGAWCVVRGAWCSATAETVAFAQVMKEQTAGAQSTGIRDEQTFALLQKATTRHRVVAQEAASCQGVDRHLFSLMSIAQLRGGPLPALFQDPTWGRLNTSILSTSNVNGIAVE